MGKTMGIDDDEYIRDIVSQFFGQQGCQAAEDGQEGISLTSRYPFDVIISGPAHAQCNGYGGPSEKPEVIPEARVVIMTAFASYESKAEAREKGAYDYVLKPINLVDIGFHTCDPLPQ